MAHRNREACGEVKGNIKATTKRVHGGERRDSTRDPFAEKEALGRISAAQTTHAESVWGKEV